MADKQPLMLTPISAGFPSPAEDKVDVSLNLHNLMVKHPEATFFMRVSGDSMEGAGIGTGDIAVVDRSLEPRNNQIVVAFIENEFTLKRYKKDAQGVWLLPENKKYQPIKIDGETVLEVWGVVTYIVKEVVR